MTKWVHNTRLPPRSAGESKQSLSTPWRLLSSIHVDPGFVTPPQTGVGSRHRLTGPGRCPGSPFSEVWRMVFPQLPRKRQQVINLVYLYPPFESGDQFGRRRGPRVVDPRV